MPCDLWSGVLRLCLACCGLRPRHASDRRTFKNITWRRKGDSEFQVIPESSKLVVISQNLFDGCVASVSLLASTCMEFKARNPQLEPQQFSLVLAPRSVVLLRKAARYQYHHGIAARHADEVVVDGEKTTVPRSRRVSLTFRKVIPKPFPIGLSAEAK
eukprot:NODE_5423_length_656_cov_15.712665_g5260_i0.p1 GENE.NODE_5423_length_656_cov_15.712665_g5260_i0~~NODE_5423_length_656_cov_15.712665_g5260_i0.p1  ORF type:complete len:158 (+),score=9.53 NODE_5423_length_656_cov_15.712665_g5260_i0:62-535(+)